MICDTELDYKDWLIRELLQVSYITVGEAHDKATKFMETGFFKESFERWKALKLDVVLASNPSEQVKFPNI